MEHEFKEDWADDLSDEDDDSDEENENYDVGERFESSMPTIHTDPWHSHYVGPRFCPDC